ncbi:hypothetical protein [Actinoplanes derwentensis]|uniref:Uncharacterized protein n=1 Tax=Actinoplanes derwentensis TaxID=113562 RepID=A0A1H2D886_9ACTN|nr:hypothetical protein [Actinoplanes derwentensis]GID86286.1 hypothetical protein Ade03nite_52100 [Actinoplanes derwentensis]SDT78692.1 hypothetical protein SAMN04489716_8477 [Actinoplanes derwentensis]
MADPGGPSAVVDSPGSTVERTRVVLLALVERAGPVLGDHYARLRAALARLE